MSAINAAVAAVRSGLCYGWLPQYRIQSDLDSGDLAPLRLPTGKTRDVRLNLVCRDLSASHQEVNALAQLLGMTGEPQVV